ncbi:MAG: D-alanyl-D-alanine carboxypeptidase [Pseudobdellovibrionaceae bacterium]
MNVLFLVLLLAFVWTPPSLGSFDKVALKKAMQRKVENSGLGPKGLGIYVATAESPSELIYELSGQQQMIPASATKIVTAAAALKAFPPGTKFKTVLLSEARIEKNVLKGDLVLKGAGDPGFVSESMWFLVNAFLRTGVQSIEGNILVDDTLFDQSRVVSYLEK